MAIQLRAPVPAGRPDGGPISVRRAADADWQECGRICFEAFASVAGRHGFPPDFPTVEAAARPIRGLINHPAIYGVVAEQAGRIAGSSFLDERSLISAIGPVSVDPVVQDGGVGRALVAAMMARASEQGAPGVRLVQIAYHNRSLSLYAKFGFDVRATLAAMHGTPLGGALPGYAVRRAYPDDEGECNRLCLRIHGHDRPGELREAIAAGTARVVEHLGRISGYTAGISYWSHSVAATNEDLEALVCAAGEIPPPGILVPLDNAELFRWGLAQGLRVFFVTNLMSVGIYQQPSGAWLPSVGY